MTLNNNISCLIVAAGKGSRSGLSYPKTLYKIDGKEILLKIMELFESYDKNPTIIVSKSGEELIQLFLSKSNRKAHLVVQEDAKGMGDAVLRFMDSPSYQRSENILLIWGDIPFISEETISKTLDRHIKENNDLTFPSKVVNLAYTIVKRDYSQNVIEVIETREENLSPTEGERDIGVFIFRRSIIMPMLQENLSGKTGAFTKEHGFLYIIKHLVKSGCKVEALPIAQSKELISLNKLSDLKE